MKIHRIKKFILDLLFPSFCVGCGIEGSLLCLKCRKQIIQVQSPVCPRCQRLSENGRYCQICRKKMALSGIIVAVYYEEGPTKEMIHNFKYNHALGLKKVLANLLVEAYRRHCEQPGVIASGSAAIHRDRLLWLTPRNDNTLVTFTPLHHRRLAERGFNQAELLAQTVSKRLKIPCESLLIKTKSTKRQVGLTGDIRRKNLTGAFKVHKVCKVKILRGKKILIIDDITTTGTTLNECAKILRAAGAKEVWGLVVSRG